MGQILSIVAIWGIYALLGCGLVLVYRTSRVLSLVHGELAVLLGYGLAAALAAKVSPWLAIPALIIAAGLLGLIIFLAALKRVIGEPPFVGLMVTVGLATMVHGLIVMLFGGGVVAIDFGSSGMLQWGDQALSKADLTAALGAWGCIVALLLAYRWTQLGTQMRAVAENATLSAMRGVNIVRVIGVAWVLAGVTAGLGGLLYGQRAVISLGAIAIGLNALIAGLIGGMDSLRGVIIGALIVALAESLTARWIDPRYAQLAPTLLLLGIMVVRPWGLFGTAEEIRRV